MRHPLQPPTIKPAGRTGLRWLLALFAAVLLCPGASAANVTLGASDTIPIVGETITVQLAVDSSTAPFASWGCQLDFPNNGLQLTGISAGDFSTFVPDSRSLAEINTTGEVRCGGESMALNAGGAGNLAILTFTVIAVGTWNLTTAAKSVAKPFGDALFDASFVQTTPGIPSALTITSRNLDTVYFNTSQTTNALESGGANGNFTLVRTGSIGALPVTVVVGGTAVPGTDYTPIPTTLVIPNGSTTLNVALVGLDNSSMPGSQSVSLTVLQDPGYYITSPQSTSALILDDLGPTTSISVDNPSPVVGDDINVTVSVAGAPNFIAWGSMLSWPAGTLKLISQGPGDFSSIIPDARTQSMIDASGEVHAGGQNVTAIAGSGSGRLNVFTFQVLSPGSITLNAKPKGAGLPFGLDLIDTNFQDVVPLAAAPLTINAQPQPQVTITSTQSTASEFGPTPAYITVSRSTSVGALVITLLATGTSSPGEWVSIPSQLTFAAGQGSITVPIMPAPDHAVTGTQTLTLSVLTGVNYTVGNPGSVTLLRLDQDGSNLALLANTTRPLVNGNVTVTLHLTDPPAFAQYGGIVHFPFAQLTLTNVAAGTGNFGTFIPDARAGLVSPDYTTINASGEVHIGGYATPLTGDALGGDGDLVTLTFLVKSAGQITLTTSNQTNGNPFGDVLLTDSGLAQAPNLDGPLVLNAVTAQAPSSLSLSNTTVHEDMVAGTLVGILSATSPNPGDTFTYALISGSGSTDNSRFTIVGDQLLTTQVLQSSVTPTCSILVQVTDSDGLSLSKNFTITVGTNGTVIFVLPGATGAGTGADWADAFTDLAPALATAISGQQIWVAGGTYLPTAGNDTTKTLAIPTGVSVFGGFAGTETLLSQRSWASNLVTLSGAILGAKSRHVVTLSQGGLLDGVVVTGGDASSAFGDQSGGGILVLSGGAGIAEIDHCIIAGNHAAGSGGGVAASGGSLAILTSILDGNVADAGAGAIAITGGFAGLTNLTLSNNSGFIAGGIDSEGSSTQAAVVNCLFDQDTVPVLRAGTSSVLTFGSCCLPPGSTAGANDYGGDILADPQLVSASQPQGNDGIWLTADDGLQEAPGSPCRLSGTTTGLPDDILGNAISGQPDIGAFQFIPDALGTAPTITSASSASGMVGVAFAFTLTASGTTPISFSATPLPAGLSLTGSSISGTPLAAGTTTVTVGAINATGSAAPQTLTITVAPGSAATAPTITSPLSATGLVGTSFSYTITTTGSTPVAVGAAPLPGGLSLFGSSIIGTPTTPGTFQVTLSASNLVGIATPELLTLTINPALPPVITSPLTADGAINTAFSYQIVATGTPPIILGVGSALPAGLTFDGSSTISGTPTAGGTTNVQLQATSPFGSDTPTLVINIGSPPTITSSLSQQATVGQAYSYSITASGATPITFTTSALPNGLVFDGAHTISGTPTVAGPFTITLGASNSFGTGTPATLTLTIGNAPSFTSTQVVYALQSSNFSYTISAAGNAPITYSVTGTLPSGLTFDGTQTISGVPTVLGATSVQLNAVNAFGSAMQGLTINVGIAPVFTSATSINVASGAAVNYTPVASGTPVITYTVSGLPAGLTFNGTSISGSTSVVGIHHATMTATNSYGSTGPTTLTIDVGVSPTISSSLNVNVTDGVAFAYGITATGGGPYAFTVGSGLPNGITFDGSHTISGTTSDPTGVYSALITVTSPFGSGSSTVNLTVGTTPAFTSPSSASLTVGVAGSYDITASGSSPITFSVVSGLPPGVTFDNNHTLSGTPTTPGTYSTVLGASSPFGSAQLTVTFTVGSSPVIQGPLTVNAPINVPLSYVITAIGTTPITFSLTSALPQGLTFDGTATISGTPTPLGTTTVGLSAVNADGNGTANLVINVGNPPLITSSLAVNLPIHIAGSYTITASGSAPITLGENLALPPGLSFDGVSVISGTPTAVGSTTVNLTASNAFGNVSVPATFTVGHPPAITSAAAVNATINSGFSYAITASGAAPVAFSVTSALPAGLTFNGAHTITGTPTAAGTTVVQLLASNAFGSATGSVTITVGLPPTITSASVVNGFTTGPISYVCTASGNAPITFTLSGSLPAGLTFDGTATISGTPLANGQSQVTIQAANAFGNGSQVLTIDVGGAPFITSSATADGAVGVPFTYLITASGATPITFTTGALPAGLTFDGTATISGTPTATGPTTVSLGASNVIGTAVPFTLTIDIETAPAITSIGTANLVVGVPFSYRITASGTGPITLGETGSLPGGLSFDGTSVISGTPTAPGTSSVTLTAISPFASATSQLQFTIAAATAPTFTSALAVVAQRGQPFTYLLTASGTPTITFTATNLPAGLTFDGHSTISGTPTTDGVTNVALTATNPGGTTPQTLVLTVATLPVITSGSATSGTQGQKLSFTLTASGTAPVTFSTTPLPAGITLNGTTIGGTPTGFGSFPVTVTASNAAGTSSPQVLTITIAAANPPVITSPLALSGTAGLPMTYIITAIGTAPISFSTAGLPPGMSRAGADITGTPTTPGTYDVTMTATNAGGHDIETLVVTVNAPVAPAITSQLSATATTGVAFSYLITATGTAPVSLAVTTALPAGLSFDGASLISGIPTAVGTTNVTLQATNAVGQSIQATLTINVSAPVAPIITSVRRATAVINTPFSYLITATGTAPIEFSAAPLPSGLSFDGNATISGTPTATGTKTVILNAEQFGWFGDSGAPDHHRHQPGPAGDHQPSDGQRHPGRLLLLHHHRHRLSADRLRRHRHARLDVAQRWGADRRSDRSRHHHRGLDRQQWRRLRHPAATGDHRRAGGRPGDHQHGADHGGGRCHLQLPDQGQRHAQHHLQRSAAALGLEHGTDHHRRPGLRGDPERHPAHHARPALDPAVRDQCRRQRQPDHEPGHRPALAPALVHSACRRSNQRRHGGHHQRHQPRRRDLGHLRRPAWNHHLRLRHQPGRDHTRPSRQRICRRGGDHQRRHQHRDQRLRLHPDPGRGQHLAQQWRDHRRRDHQHRRIQPGRPAGADRLPDHHPRRPAGADRLGQSRRDHHHHPAPCRRSGGYRHLQPRRHPHHPQRLHLRRPGRHGDRRRHHHRRQRDRGRQRYQLGRSWLRHRRRRPLAAAVPGAAATPSRQALRVVNRPGQLLDSCPGTGDFPAAMPRF